jgi:putative two-component system response regulator
MDAAADFLRSGSGAHFDPACVTAFLSCWDEMQLVRNKYQEDLIDL